MLFSDSVTEIKNLFELEISLSTTLLQIMKSEQSTLSANDLEAFTAVIAQKNKVLAEIESTEAALSTHLKSAGLAMASEGLDEMILKSGPQDKKILESLVTRLRSIAAKCQEQNLINSKIIEAGNNSIKKLVSMIRGQTTDQSDLYDLTGKSATPGQTQILGRV